MTIATHKAFSAGEVIVRASHINVLIRRQATRRHIPEGELFMCVLTQAVTDLSNQYRVSAQLFFSDEYSVKVCAAAGVDHDWLLSLIAMIGERRVLDITDDEIVEDEE